MNLLNFVFTAQFETPLLEDLNPEYLEQEEAFELLAEAGAVVLWLKLLSSAPGPLDTGSVTYLIDMAQTARSVPSLQKLFETAEWVLSLRSRPASVEYLGGRGRRRCSFLSERAPLAQFCNAGAVGLPEPCRREQIESDNPGEKRPRN